MKKITFLVVLFVINIINAQETIGLILEDVNADKSNGYTLFNARSDDRVFLIDNCQRPVYKCRDL